MAFRVRKLLSDWIVDVEDFLFTTKRPLRSRFYQDRMRFHSTAMNSYELALQTPSYRSLTCGIDCHAFNRLGPHSIFRKFLCFISPESLIWNAGCACTILMMPPPSSVPTLFSSHPKKLCDRAADVSRQNMSQRCRYGVDIHWTWVSRS